MSKSQVSPLTPNDAESIGRREEWQKSQCNLPSTPRPYQSKDVTAFTQHCPVDTWLLSTRRQWTKTDNNSWGGKEMQSAAGPGGGWWAGGLNEQTWLHHLLWISTVIESLKKNKQKTKQNKTTSMTLKEFLFSVRDNLLLIVNRKVDLCDFYG